MLSVGAYQRKKRRIKFLDISHDMKVRIVIAMMQFAIAKRTKQGEKFVGILQRDVRKSGPFVRSSIKNVFDTAKELEMMVPADADKPELYRKFTKLWVEILDEDLRINEDLNKQDNIKATKNSYSLLLKELRQLLDEFNTVFFPDIRK